MEKMIDKIKSAVGLDKPKPNCKDGKCDVYTTAMQSINKVDEKSRELSAQLHRAFK